LVFFGGAFVAIQRLYHRLFVLVFDWPKSSLVVMIVVIGAVLSLFPYLGGEFLPRLAGAGTGIYS
jgi:Cu/Ag efflux pump CusA